MIGSGVAPASSYPGGQMLAGADTMAAVATVTVTATAALTTAIELMGTASLTVTATAALPLPLPVPAVSSHIDQALLAMLGADATLLSYMPDGVYWAGEVPPGSTRFVEVSLTDHADVWVFQHPAFEDELYLVKAVMLSSSGEKSAIAAAEARIDALLDGQILGIGIPPDVDGYTFMEMAREQRLRQTEPDAVDPSLIWWHRGGYYRIQMAVEMAA